MKDNLNRKSEDESNKMLKSDPSTIFKKTIQILKKKYGYSSKQIVSEYTIPHDFESLRADIALFSKDNIQNPIIIGEVKIGNFVLPYGEYQLEEYLKISNAKYGFLTNGVEWINYQLVNGKLIQIGDIPNAKELEQADKEEIFVKKPLPTVNLENQLRKTSHSLWVSGLSEEAIFQLLTFKLFDEVTEHGNNFDDMLKNPQDCVEIVDKLWDKINKEYSQLFSTNYFSHLTSARIHSIIMEVANLSLIESDPISISQFLLKKYVGNVQKSGKGNNTPFELVKFIYELLEISENDRLVIPFSGPETLVHTLDVNYSKYPKKVKTNDPKIITIEPQLNKSQFLNIISLLDLPKFHVFTDDPISSGILLEFKNTNFVISIPPFGRRISKDYDILGNYGNEEIHYYLKRLISTFDIGTRIAVVVPQGFLFRQSTSAEKIRQEIFNSCTLKGIFQLPSNVFQPYSGIQTSLIILEIGVSKKDSYNIFMSILPKSDRSSQKFNKEILDEILNQFHIFTKKSIVKNETQNAFTIPSHDLSNDVWTVPDKIPELKQLLDVSYKTRLLDVVSVFRGTSVMGETGDYGKDIPYIRISDLENGFIKSNIKKIVKIDRDLLSKFERSIVKKNDILLSCRGTLGKAAIVDSHNEGNLASSQIMILRTKSKILPEYLVYILNSEFVQKQIAVIARGVSQPYFTINELEKIIISVPPIKEQKQIVSEFLKLEQEIAKLEKTLAKKRVELGRLIKK